MSTPDQLASVVKEEVQISYGAWMTWKPGALKEPLASVTIEDEDLVKVAGALLKDVVDDPDEVAKVLINRLKLYSMSQLRRSG